MARSHAPDADAADVFKQNNPWKRADFSVKAPGMDWDAYFKSAGVADQPIGDIRGDPTNKLEALRVGPQGERPDRLFHDIAELERCGREFKFTCFDLGVVENVVDHGEQRVGR